MKKYVRPVTEQTYVATVVILSDSMTLIGGNSNPDQNAGFTYGGAGGDNDVVRGKEWPSYDAWGNGFEE